LGQAEATQDVTAGCWQQTIANCAGCLAPLGPDAHQIMMCCFMTKIPKTENPMSVNFLLHAFHANDLKLVLITQLETDPD